MKIASNLPQTIIAALVSGAVVGAVAGAVLKWQFDRNIEEFKSLRNRNEAALVEVIGPATTHFARTEAIALRYGKSDKQLFGDADLLRSSNETMRNLLVSKSYLIPPSLVKASTCLIIHYDIWLKRFDGTMQKFRSSNYRTPAMDEDFDVGFSRLENRECGDFPRYAPPLFEAEFKRLRKELYGIE